MTKPTPTTTGHNPNEGMPFAGYQIMTVRPIGYTELEAIARTTDGELVALHMLNWDRLQIHYGAKYFRACAGAPQPGEIEEKTTAKLQERDREYRANKERALGFRHERIGAIRKLGRQPTNGQTIVEAEYVPGAPLLQEATGMNWQQRLFFIPPILDALQALHDRSVLHGNLKHRRIRATYAAGRPVATLIDPGYFVPMHQWPPTLLGTAEYLPPEVVMGEKDQIDQRADLYCLGHLMYGLFTNGRYAHEDRHGLGNERKDLAEAIAKEPQPMPPSMHERSLPAALDQLILRCIAKDPTKRPQSTTEVMRELMKHWPEACTELQTTELTMSVESQME